MNTQTARTIIYNFFKEQIIKAYPKVFKLDANNACGKIFFDRLKQTRPARPYIMLSEGELQKIYKRFESYTIDGITYTRQEFRLPVTFGVYTLANRNNLTEADNTATEIIEYINNLFLNTQSTFDYLSNKGITVNELESSDIRDLSQFQQTNQEFRKEIDIMFEFDNISQNTAELGEALGVNIEVAGTDVTITGDFTK